MDAGDTGYNNDGGKGFSAKKVKVVNQLGMHARPASILAQEADKFTSDIRIICDEQDVDAKSILDIMTLAAGFGSEMEIKAYGPDSEEAVEHIAELFENAFGETRA